jgi:hypothetical protein
MFLFTLSVIYGTDLFALKKNWGVNDVWQTFFKNWTEVGVLHT